MVFKMPFSIDNIIKEVGKHMHTYYKPSNTLTPFKTVLILLSLSLSVCLSVCLYLSLSLSLSNTHKHICSSPSLWVNSRADWVLQLWNVNWSRRRNTQNSKQPYSLMNYFVLYSAFGCGVG